MRNSVRCLLTSGGKVVETFTDGYGDFWFKDLAVGTYQVNIEARGFMTMFFSDLRPCRDINLGDMPLDRRE